MSKSIVTRKIPYMYTKKIDDLNSTELLLLEHVYHINKSDFILLDRGREYIVFNQDLPNVKELQDITKKIMENRYLDRNGTEALFDKFLSLTSDKAHSILMHIWVNWKNELIAAEQKQSAENILKQIRSNRLSFKAKKQLPMIKELFDIGFGLYDKSSKCNFEEGAKNAFMYGYLLGKQENGGETYAYNR